jgi:hypothetical protein
VAGAGLADLEAAPSIVSAESYYNSYILYTSRTPDGSWNNAPVDITVMCGTY